MKRLQGAGAALGALLAAALAPGAAPVAASLPTAWEYSQSLTIPSAGLVEVRIPPETLDRALPGCDDLRVIDGAGREVPYTFRAVTLPGAGATGPPAAEEISLGTTRDATVGVYRTRTRGLVDTVLVRTPARDFIKPVTVEASADRVNWRLLALRYPIFRQSDGAARLEVRVPTGDYPFLRITVDDNRDRPIPVTGIATNPAPPDPPELEVVPVPAAAVGSEYGVTRILFGLPTRHLSLFRVTLRPEDPVFSREVSVAARVTEDGEVREQVLARGRIHRVAVAGAERTEVLSLPVSTRSLASRSLVVTIEDGDSPPLTLRQPLELTVLPVVLRFVASAGERYDLVVGNRSAKLPRYDLAALAAPGRLPAAAGAVAGPLRRNPAYREAEAAPGAPTEGKPVDVGRWRAGRQVLGVVPGVLSLEIPPDILAQSPQLADLRLVAEGRQIPFIVERNGPVRRSELPLEALPAVAGGRISRWRLRLPHPGLPLQTLICPLREPVFHRPVALFEETTPERGGKRYLAGGVWERRGEADARTPFSLALNTRLSGDTLLLEVDDGDNLPLHLQECAISWRTSRLLFKAPAGKEVTLLYGNDVVGPPQYDLALLAEEILAAEAHPATLAPSERHTATRGYSLPAGGGRIAFWGALVLVVAVLIVVIARLLPEPEGKS